MARSGTRSSTAQQDATLDDVDEMTALPPRRTSDKVTPTKSSERAVSSPAPVITRGSSTRKTTAVAPPAAKTRGNGSVRSTRSRPRSPSPSPPPAAAATRSTTSNGSSTATPRKSGKRAIEVDISPTKRDAQLSTPVKRVKAQQHFTTAPSTPQTAFVTPPSTATRKTPIPGPSSATPGSSRRSNRVRNLPIEQRVVDDAPACLQSVLVGWHDPEALASTQKRREQATVDEEADDTGSDDKEEERPRTASPSPSAHHQARAEAVTDSNMYPREVVQMLVDSVMVNLSGETGHQYGLADAARSDDPTQYPCLPHYETWERAMRYSMANVVKSATGSCFLAVGARGAGKSLLVERCMGALTRTFGSGSFQAVYLNGFIHTTDHLALRSIAYQINVACADDDSKEQLLDSGTMAALLTMLEPQDDTKASHKPIIIILEEFDLFALHPRQSFLYSLLDIVQGNRRKAGLGIIGLSARTDCLSMLEKRVKSRCQSQVYQIAPSNTWDIYMDMIVRFLTPSVDNADLLAQWTTSLKAFLEKPATKRHLQRQWSTHGCNPAHALQSTLFEAACDWSPDTIEEQCPIPALDSTKVKQLEANAGRSGLLEGCTLLELHVCVAAKHVKQTTDNQMNVEELYDAYKQHCARTAGAVPTRPFPRSAFSMAFDELVAREAFIPANSKPTLFVAPSAGDKFRKYRFLPWDSTVDAVVTKRSDAPERLKRWCTHWSD